MKTKTKYRFNFKKFALNVFILIVFIIISFFLKLHISDIITHRESEKYNIVILKRAVQSAGNINTYKIAQDFLNKFPKSDYKGYAYFITGKYYYEKGDYKKAIADFQKASDNYLEEELKIILYLHISYNYMCINDIVSSSEYANKVYELLEKGKLKSLAAFQLGLCYSAFKLFDEAILKFEEVSEKSEDDELIRQAEEEKLKILKKLDLQKAEKFEKIIINKYNQDNYNEKKISP
ncbi:MAG: tetratricopeptide repeat protein [Candidatus Muirbacterium halophilum]|nr:tetratricopeptide repeat protein [Candidatus Muirbacterium halophilum]MCK9475317.1 tetratricopeptide repeat protein [Candidatus Muirbacterium halophilum]